MTTPKQLTANAFKHSILTQRLIIDGESTDEYRQLLDGLMQALQPHGAYELILVERMALSVWRQRRLANAERAGIELSRRLNQQENLERISTAIGRNRFMDGVEFADTQPLTEDDNGQIEWCIDVLKEHSALVQADWGGESLEAMQKAAPLMIGQLESEAEDDQMALEDYVAGLKDGLSGWAIGLDEWCRRELEKFDGRGLIREVAALVQAEQSSPVSNEVLARYQHSLDSELYKAADALRKQQQWRMKGLIAEEAA